ncbi:hypothetical protein, partial [Streptomyces minutiscleroticus]|uniref:hypothetical protein n=1 Tax=Streptomyces minutiscleroticus TaxID=68238 RepID=UPI00333124EC
MTTIASTGRTTTAQRQARRSKTEGQQPQKSTDGLRMHILHARLPLPYLTPGDVSANIRTVASRIPSRPMTMLRTPVASAAHRVAVGTGPGDLIRRSANQ